MTNAEIIFKNRVFLMEQGVIKGQPGTVLNWKDGEGERQILIPEEIHTFQSWKALGYQVQKGEHAVARFPVWKFKAGKKQEQEAGGDEEPQKGRCFMKVAFFFTMDQVKPMEKKEVK